MKGGAATARGTSKAVTRIAVAAQTALVAGQSLLRRYPGAAARVAHSAAQQPMTAALAAQLSKNVNEHVIVIMKSQPAAAAEGTAASTERAAMIAGVQAPLMSELRQVHATHVKSYRLVDSFAATVSKGEEARLKATPGSGSHPGRRRSSGGPPQQRRQPRSRGQVRGQRIADAQRDPRRLRRERPGAARPRGAVADAHRLGQPARADRALARHHRCRREGRLDRRRRRPEQRELHPAQRHVGVRPRQRRDYQDFTGDGPGQPTSGDEAFLDSNTIAGQGIHVYNVNGFPPSPTRPRATSGSRAWPPAPAWSGSTCSARFEDTTESNFLQAINYAVETDHVNVLNESFGSNPFPDVTALDATKQFNDAAVAAGVVVSVSSGDAGSTNTIGSPATDPNVISVGASTRVPVLRPDQLRRRALLRDHRLAERQHQLAELRRVRRDRRHRQPRRARRPQLRLLRREPAIYAGCVNFQGQSSDIEESGGTSESSPFVAGAAALVIQAYRKTHGGATPTPALVKQILISTATDLGAPATEQGAGLLNSYKAVQLAESIHTSDGSPDAGRRHPAAVHQPAERGRRPRQQRRAGRSRSPTPARPRRPCT